MGFFDLFRGMDVNEGVKTYRETEGAVLLDVRGVRVEGRACRISDAAAVGSRIPTGESVTIAGESISLQRSSGRTKNLI